MTSTVVSPSQTAGQSPPGRRLSRSRWSDRRILVGAALAALSVFGVAQVVGAADQTTSVWTVTRDLGDGVTVTTDDVAMAAVRLDQLGPYFVGSSSPVGTVTTRSFASGELVTRSGVVSGADTPDLRWLTLPIERNHLPGDLQRGEQVDVYLVERTPSGEPTGEPVLVLAEATVAEVADSDSRFGGGGLELGISLSVPVEDVAPLVAAEARGMLTLVRVPADAD